MPQGSKLEGVKSMSIHAYEYAKEGDYPMSEVEAIVKRVESDGSWKRVLNAREEKERVDIFLKTAGGKVEGFLLVAAEAKEVEQPPAMRAAECITLFTQASSGVKPYFWARVALGRLSRVHMPSMAEAVREVKAHKRVTLTSGVMLGRCRNTGIGRGPL